MTIQIYKEGRLAMAPNFVPLALAQVADLPAGAQLFRTAVPAGYKFLAFHRGVGFTDNINWIQTVSNGYHALNFPNESNKQTPTRVYIFSNLQVNIPDYGFYVYNNGVMVWHSNCLPLKIFSLSRASNTLGGEVANHNQPLAINSAITGSYQMGTGPEQGFYGWRNCAAGFSSSGQGNNGNWCTMNGTINQLRYETPTSYPGNSMIPAASYIETGVYDQYYQAALGY